MRIYLILDADRERDAPNRPTQDVLAALEEELEAIDLDVDGTVYAITVRGIGRNATQAEQSYRLRRMR